MIEESVQVLIAEKNNRKIVHGRRAAVRAAVNVMAQRQSVQPRQAARRDTGLPIQWLRQATKCDCAAAAIAIKVIPGTANGQEVMIPGPVFRRWLKTTDKIIAALERLRIHGLVSWKQTGDAFKLVPHLH